MCGQKDSTIPSPRCFVHVLRASAPQVRFLLVTVYRVVRLVSVRDVLGCNAVEPVYVVVIKVCMGNVSPVNLAHS